MEPATTMNFYTIDDLKGIISLMSKDDIKQISQADLLSQLDSRRELRSKMPIETPIQEAPRGPERVQRGTPPTARRGRPHRLKSVACLSS